MAPTSPRRTSARHRPTGRDPGAHGARRRAARVPWRQRRPEPVHRSRRRARCAPAARTGSDRPSWRAVGIDRRRGPWAPSSLAAWAHPARGCSWPISTSALAGELAGRSGDPNVALHADVDIAAPCALGGVVSESNVEPLRCGIVCGSANNQLAHEGLAEDLERRGILYAPDFVANAGGLINVAPSARATASWRRSASAASSS